MKIVKERICPLIHLNCPPDINCQQCINIQQYPAFLGLKSVFASQSQLDKKTDSEEYHNQQQTESTSSLSLITSSIKILSSLIDDNNICKEVVNISNALHSLSKLSIYKINIHFNQENDIQTFELRKWSRVCLDNIWFFGDASAQTELVNANYARVLVIAISTASGSGEEQDGWIWSGLNHISQFLNSLHQGRNYNASFLYKPLLARRSDEQIEEEGANEEIYSQLISNGKFIGFSIKDTANEAKEKILNFFIDLSNPKPDWYEDQV
ncbi:MAG: hypothetical protein EZS28_009979 [Streblomastix strix]|uniref:Uncharacterized protein n=1 Tax=Streblomastix strix TaxID=222440 RepID=A0A5J4WIF4_9EUKA|nr:MAG: hypothetical protein EZS28_009979 [Streblomastix strix]